MFRFKTHGFSLVELLLVAAGISGLALVIMEIQDRVMKSQGEALALADFIEIKKEISSVLDNPKACKASLGGITFQGQSIQNTPVEIEELWAADQDGNRSRKRIFKNQKYGRLFVRSMNFRMPDYTAATNFSTGTGQSFNADLWIEVTKQTIGPTRQFHPITLPMKLSFMTDSSGISTILNCSGINENAVKSFLDRKYEILTGGGTSGTWVVPPDVKEIRVTLLGAGGGGAIYGHIGGLSGSNCAVSNHGATNGTSTTFGSLTATGGKAGGAGANGADGAPQDVVFGIYAAAGGPGGDCVVNNDPYPATIKHGYQGGKGGLLVKKLNVTPGESFFYAIGKGGQGSVSSPTGQAGQNGQIIIEY